MGKCVAAGAVERRKNLIIISHRGYWKTEKEKNTTVAFKYAFSNGFGTETDIRDYRGQLVISHDIPDGLNISLDTFLKTYSSYDKELFLMLNIKSNGLCRLLKNTLQLHQITNFAIFDASITDTIEYKNNGVNFFTRQSEYEQQPVFYKEALGVWLDEINSHWINSNIIIEHIRCKKLVCIVSPELHRREYLKEWEDYRKLENKLSFSGLMLCTDFPQKAKEFFNG